MTTNTGATGAVSTLSDWAGEYVTDLLGKAQALGPAVYDETGKLVSGRPYQQYGTEQAKYYGDVAKNLVAGPTEMQQKIFSGIGNLTMPTGFGEAAADLKELSKQNVAFKPTEFSSSYSLPEYEAAKFQSFFTSPEAYKAATLTPEEFNMQTLQQYMNPYLQSVLDPQLREAQRLADIERTKMQGRMAQAGAYGGSRQAIMEAEAQRNLLERLSDITGKGYYEAYESGSKRFDEAFKRQLDSAKFQEESRQFGAQYALDTAKARAAAELEAAKQTELSRQFGYGEKAKSASEAARLKLEAQKASDLSRKYAADTQIANLGKQLEAARAKADAAAAEGKFGLDALKTQLDVAEAERKLEQAEKDVAYKQFLREEEDPYKQLEFQKNIIAGIPGISSVLYPQPEQDALSAALGGAKDLAGLLTLLKLIPSGSSTTTPTTP